MGTFQQNMSNRHQCHGHGRKRLEGEGAACQQLLRPGGPARHVVTALVRPQTGPGVCIKWPAGSEMCQGTRQLSHGGLGRQVGQ